MITRRNFLGTTAAGVAGGLLGRSAHAASGETRTFGVGNVTVPAVGLGTWITFNVGKDQALLDRSVRVMRAFFEQGGGMIDSSPMYGSAQDTLGHGLAALGGQPTLFSADKVWTSSVAEGPDQLAQSRRNWGLDAFDLAQVHNLVAVEGHLEWLFQRKAEGRVGYVGITTSHGRRHSDIERLMQAQPLDFVQLTYNVLDREAEARLLPMAHERGIGVIVNRPFRRGALISRTRGATLPGFARELGADSWAQLMLQFVLSHPAVTVVIPATTSPDHVRENKAAARATMPDDDLRARISQAVAQL